MLMVVFAKEVGLDCQNTIEIKGALVEQIVDRNQATFGAMDNGVGLSTRMRDLIWASSSAETRSTLLIRIVSANAICVRVSSLSSSCWSKCRRRPS